jgi:hypothetical protein
VENTQQTWAEYYRLRNQARIGLLAFVVAGFLLPIPIGILSVIVPSYITWLVFFSAIGVAAFVCAVPIAKWGNLRCPRCGKRFAEPKWFIGGYAVLLLPFFGGLCLMHAAERAN